MFSNNQDGRDYTQIVSLDNNQNYNELRDYDQGGLAKTILRPVPLRNTRYMLIDWLNPFRAIYLPLAHQAGPGFEDLCVYLMIDFRLRQGVQIRNGSGNLVSLRFDRERGLTYRHGDVLSFDLKGIYDYLILPQQLRAPEKGLYRTQRRGDELITLWDRLRPTPIRSGSGAGPGLLPTTRPFTRHIDLVTVINDNFGVDVTWQPYQYSSWVVDFLLHVTNLALGFVPGVGPLLAVSFSVGMQIIMDPDGFREQNPLHLAADIIAALIDSGTSARGNLPQSHRRSGAMLLISKSPSEEPAEPELPYVENRGFKPSTEDQGDELAEQKSEDGGDVLAEPKSEDQWEETVEQQVGQEEGPGKQGEEQVGQEEGAGKQGEEHEEKQNAESGARGETEKTLGGDQDVDSKETSISEQKADDEKNQVIKPKPEPEDEVSRTIEEKEDDAGNQIASQDVETEKGPGAEAYKDTLIAGHKAEDNDNRVVEPKSKDEPNRFEDEKVREQEQQSAKETAEDETRIADPDAKDQVSHTGDQKIKDGGEQGPKQDVEDEVKSAKPNVENDAKPAAEPKALDKGNETADSEVVSEETQPAKQTTEDDKKDADAEPNAQDDENLAAGPKAEDKVAEPVDPKPEDEEKPSAK